MILDMAVVSLTMRSFGRRMPLRRVSCCGPGGREILIDSSAYSGRTAAAAPQHDVQQ